MLAVAEVLVDDVVGPVLGRVLVVFGDDYHPIGHDVGGVEIRFKLANLYESTAQQKRNL